ncbi:hypothetical protein R7X12_03285 [Mesomycoplasma ovipneumoniae]|nr:hypothetical protein [Mesomycoplasma ovipneumoniae]MDW2907317.1 hypothetical protein [Mesomycoplasma ovipneumoniae]MDW2911386.1 hypothetical protein [Mesomycoplasma ovipneumoniae]MDW2913867.1 hypothetical protein [Mesomycoplasma ovipneumoniae]MDW2915926.1 hypothetical protein [Mesomycoplasma ovipneumoniae]MDW2919509.1 hypothetical protein [Mesomycoplasma ovipneumoniae]
MKKTGFTGIFAYLDSLKSKFAIKLSKSGKSNKLDKKVILKQPS